METKYTNGKWIIPRFAKRHVQIEVPYGDNRTICICDENDFIHPEEAEANAKLIASAPELIEALIKIKESMQESAKFNGESEADKERMSIVKKAIKKATE